MVAIAMLDAAERGGLREEWRNSPAEMLADPGIDVPRSLTKSPR